MEHQIKDTAYTARKREPFQPPLYSPKQLTAVAEGRFSQPKESDPESSSEELSPNYNTEHHS